MKKLKKTTIKNYTGFTPNLMGLVDPIREGYYTVESKTVSGNAPKDFIRIYEYGKGRKSKPSNWPAYIAKVGHKWYPNESITEQLMTRIGQMIGIKVADSQLMLAKGQLRFLSKYFLNAKKESLVHGSEIFSAYLEDEEFVKQVDEADQTKDFFTFQTIRNALYEVYPENADKILTDFINMLLFDAIVGNNDRHFANWGVIENIEDKSETAFAPVYDTARGLFWNKSESNLKPYLEHESKLDSYVNKSFPTTGWNNKRNLNHFELLDLVVHNYPQNCDFILTFGFKTASNDIKSIINDEFREFLSTERRYLVERCITKRIFRIQKLIS